MRLGILGNESWPTFLDILSSDPDGAFALFYTFAVHQFDSQPPRSMKSLNENDRRDCVQNIIMHIIKEDFRVLRTYKPSGKSFAGWLNVVAHNKTLDFLRKKGREPEVYSIHADGDNPGIESFLADSKDSQESRQTLKDILGSVRQAMDSIGKKCRLLLELAADELTPKEMVAVLRLGSDQNKKVSDDLRFCRRKLKEKIVEAGYDLTEYLPN